jgi:hypothetical protein
MDPGVRKVVLQAIIEDELDIVHEQTMRVARFLVLTLLVLEVERDKIHWGLDHFQVLGVGRVDHPKTLIDVKVGQEADRVGEDKVADMLTTSRATVDSTLLLRVEFKECGLVAQHNVAILMHPHLAISRHALNIFLLPLIFVVSPHRLAHQAVLLFILHFLAIRAK